MKISFDEYKPYCVDMSALIKLDSEFPKSNETFEAIWTEIESLIAQGQFFTSDYVEQEANEYVGDHTFIKDWIKKHKKKLVIPTDAEILIAAGKVINENLASGFLNRKKWEEGKNEADPYLIAIGMTKGHVIITGENKVKPNKIPQVAKKYGVQSIDIYDFFKERGLKMVKT